MSVLKQQAESIMAQIDGLQTMIERHKMSLDMFENISTSVSPISFLLDLLKHLGLGYDQIVEWLASYIIYATPLLEIAIKGVLLAKLKSNIDCNLDPQIPKFLREEVGGCTVVPLFKEDENQQLDKPNGIEIDLSSIDYNGMLNNSPMSDRSQYLYFGTN